ncbi:hypothetical protein [Streptomyces sp. NPDC051662]|uniref:hypothetical protein n=1 Tax=Streptomyces sp. NPDC051662 TaxID=3154750 RepID=UPI003422EC58
MTPSPSSPSQAPAPPSDDWRRPAIVVAGLVVLFLAMLSAFALPPLHSKPHDIPIAVAGPSGPAGQLRDQLREQDPGAFDIATLGNGQEAKDRILDRDAYGAFVTDGTHTTVLVAGAASPAVANTLKTLAVQLGEAQGAAVPVEDVRPLPPDDPTGAGLSAGAFPLALGGWICAAVLLATVPRQRQRVVAAFAFSVTGAMALTALLQYGFGSLDGNYWLTSAGAALGIAATAWTILGLRTAFGNAGLGLGAVTMIFVGNPLSGLSSAPELLPSGWGTLGQFLPPGATGSLLRSFAFFDGAGSARPLIVLSCWLAGGLALYVIGLRRLRGKGAAVPSANSEGKPSSEDNPSEELLPTA